MPSVDLRDARILAKASKGPPLLADPQILVEMIPDFETTQEWRAAIAGSHYEKWAFDRTSTSDLERIRRAVAVNLIRKLRDSVVGDLVMDGDLFWLALALNVAQTAHVWHQSSRVQLNVLRALRRRLAREGLSDQEKQQISDVLEQHLLRKVDTGAGEEFKAIALIARTIPTAGLITGLQERIRSAEKRSVRINALRMLDCVNGLPYRRYRDCL